MKIIAIISLFSIFFLWEVNADLASQIIWNSSETLIENENMGTDIKSKWFIISLIWASLADSINPCAFAIMFLLLSSIMQKSGSMKRTIFSWLLFILAIFVTYTLIGLWLFTALNSIREEAYTYIAIFVWILWIIIWLLNIKDFFWYWKWWFVIWIPKSWKPFVNSLAMWITSPTWAFFIGIAIWLLLLPCTSGPYLVIISALSGTSWEYWMLPYYYLVLYNIIFTIPMFMILAIVWLWFKKVSELQRIRNENIRIIHLVIGLIMIWIWLYVLFTA